MGVKIRLRMIGGMPMPIDVSLTYKDGSKENGLYPQLLHVWRQAGEDIPFQTFDLEWTSLTYQFEISRAVGLRS